jgi:hypothetical protein
MFKNIIIFLKSIFLSLWLICNYSIIINNLLQYNIFMCCLGNTTVIRGFRFDTSFYWTFHLAELQLFTVQIYNTSTRRPVFWFLTVAAAVTDSFELFLWTVSVSISSELTLFAELSCNWLFRTVCSNLRQP